MVQAEYSPEYSPDFFPGQHEHFRGRSRSDSVLQEQNCSDRSSIWLKTDKFGNWTTQFTLGRDVFVHQQLRILCSRQNKGRDILCDASLCRFAIVDLDLIDYDRGSQDACVVFRRLLICLYSSNVLLSPFS